jgi:hypothetical protein
MEISQSQSILFKILIFSFLVQAIDPSKLLFWNLRTFGEHRASEEIGNQLSLITDSNVILLFAEIRDSDCSTNLECPLRKFFEHHFPSHQLYLSPSLHYCDHCSIFN